MAIRNRQVIKVIDVFFFLCFCIPVLFTRIFQSKHHDIEKILIFELYGIGDVVMMSTILAALRKKYPQARIVLLSKKYGEVLLKNNDVIDEFISFEFPWSKFSGKHRFWSWDWSGLRNVIRQLRSYQFDLALDARGDLRNNMVSWLIGANKRVGYSWLGGKLFLSDDLTQDFCKQHRVDAWLHLLKYLKVDVKQAKPSLCINAAGVKWGREFLRNQGINPEDTLMGIHPGAAVKLRCWPLKKFEQVGRFLQKTYQAKVLVFVEPGTYGDDMVFDENMIKVRCSLAELMILISLCDLFVCNDSGPMHIACALDRKVVSIFGPGDKNVIGPYLGDFVCVQKNNMGCRPCFDKCIRKSVVCLEVISIAMVEKQIEKIMSKVS